MSSEVKVVAYTKECNSTETMNEEMTLLSGKAAGVCYMPDDYLSNGIQNNESALKRAVGTAKSGHHSVYDHAHISFVINTNKMMAMVMNSLGVYTTSEKSARYTIMKPETPLEKEMYDKWTGIIHGLIKDKYPTLDDKIISTRLKKKYPDTTVKVVGAKAYNEKPGDINEEMTKVINDMVASDNTLPTYKLASENARYMISVFTPTTMMYTISFRQAMLIIDYLRKLSIDCNKNKSTFYLRLRDESAELADAFEKAIGEMRIHDNKNQGVRLFENCNELEPMDKNEVIGDSYTLRYKASLACLAQLHRHRTIRYTMFIGKEESYTFYVPPIVKDAGMEDEWLSDIKSVAYCIPQGTLVSVTEQGIFEDFALKCKERLCGRAQLEITRLTAMNLLKFTGNECVNLCKYNTKLLNSMIEVDDCGVPHALARCRFPDFKCSEGCNWGSGDYLRRLI